MSYRIGTEFGFTVDVSVPASAYVLSKSWQAAERRAVERFTHVIVEAVRHPLGRSFDQTVEQQVTALRRSGVKVAMLAHGSDVRRPSVHAAAHEDSPFRDVQWSTTRELERTTRANLALLERLGLPVFVSTLGLLADLPGAEWLPVVVEASRWHAEREPLQNRRPIVAHVPSNGRLKGSDLVDPVLQRLHAEGLIEYLRVSGVPASEMPAVYARADIVLDQFRLGDYGVAACEALAAGRVVVGHIDDQIRAEVVKRTGRALPIVEARGATIERTIRGVLDDRPRFRSLAAEGASFVRAVHDGRMSAAAMRRFLIG
jgi:hypothetical protein